MKSTDVVVIGAGHNGLVCAGYLAKAGLDVLVVERSHRIGGACVTEELVPGFRFSTFAYGAHGPGAKICRDLEIPAEAIDVVEGGPGFFPFPDGDHIWISKDAVQTARSLERFGAGEADGYLAYCDFMKRSVTLAQDWFFSPPLPTDELYRKYRGTPNASILEAMLTRSHWDVMGDYFNNEKIKAALAKADDVGYPTAVGSLLAEAVEFASNGAGIHNKPGMVRGGMGTVTAALAAAARRYGAKIRTESPVERILIEHGRAAGVRLASGETLRSRLVVSNADPKRTFLKLVAEGDLADDFRRQVERIKTRAGYMKYLAIITGVPAFRAIPRELAGDARAVSAVRISPSLEYIERAWLDAQSGIPARNPIMSLQLPTAQLPEMAKPGRHIFGAWVRFAPARPREGDWKTLRDPTRRNLIRVMEEYAPGFGGLVEWDRLYTPADIERETGITDGSIRHVDMTLDQMLSRRPLPAWSAYRSPISGLWLCGSGTHPCGSVTGGPGHNAAAAILAHFKPPLAR